MFDRIIDESNPRYRGPLPKKRGHWKRGHCYISTMTAQHREAGGKGIAYSLTMTAQNRGKSWSDPVCAVTRVRCWSSACVILARLTGSLQPVPARRDRSDAGKTKGDIAHYCVLCLADGQ
jgi:hypothetical protein